MRYRVVFYQHSPSYSVLVVEADNMNFYEGFVMFWNDPKTGSHILSAFNQKDVESVMVVTDED